MSLESALLHADTIPIAILEEATQLARRARTDRAYRQNSGILRLCSLILNIRTDYDRAFEAYAEAKSILWVATCADHDDIDDLAADLINRGEERMLNLERMRQQMGYLQEMMLHHDARAGVPA